MHEVVVEKGPLIRFRSPWLLLQTQRGSMSRHPRDAAAASTQSRAHTGIFVLASDRASLFE